MGVKIGIPRALLYYKQAPFWQSFFTELGADVIVSPVTNSQILNIGLEAASSEVCLPVKVFYGHAISLADKCDYVFVPRTVSIENDAYTCPKFLGLPDMLRALPQNLPILSIDINAKKKRRYFYQALVKLGSRLGKNPVATYRAYIKAQKALGTFQEEKLSGRLASDILNPTFSPDTRLSRYFQRGHPTPDSLKIGVVGHPYNVYDPYISLNFIERLKKQHVHIRTSESVPHQIIAGQIAKLPKSIYWSYEKEVVGSVMHWLENNLVDGIIYLLAFACGPDSLIQVLIEDQARKKQDIPLMPMIIDEHSGEAGFLTRMEAFIDMLKHKKIKAAVT